MNKPHKHAALIKAWADGAKIQYREHGDIPWKDTEPAWVDRYQYRIKPKTVKYRVGLFLNTITGYSPTIVVTKETEKYYSSLPHFVKWISDWQEVEV